MDAWKGIHVGLRKLYGKAYRTMENGKHIVSGFDLSFPLSPFGFLKLKLEFKHLEDKLVSMLANDNGNGWSTGIINLIYNF